MDRRLTTILAADLAGYSRLMSADEEGVIRRLRAARAEVIEPAVAAAGGRIVKTMGDGLLVEFGSPVAAVRAALAVQDGMRTREAGEAADRRLRFRIGINLGDVVIDGEDVLGDAVNVAARLESLAPVGGLCIGRSVHDAVAGKVAAEMTALGPQPVKNLPRPVEVWSVAVEGAEAPALPSAAGRGRPSIAVLPFENLSRDPEQDFLADGIVEDATAALAQFRWLRVTARGSAFAYRGSGRDVREIARELGVRYALQGSLRRAGSRLRLSAQLADGETGEMVASLRFDRDAADLFDLQDELTAAVVGALAPEIGAHERSLARARPTGSLTAWEMFQRAQAEYFRYTPDGVDAAEDYARRATEADPDMACAWAMRGRVQVARLVGGRAPDPAAAKADIKAFSERALECDPRDEISTVLAGIVPMIEGRPAASLELAERGLERMPDSADLLSFAAFLQAGSDPEAALARWRRHWRINPADPFGWIHHAWAAMASLNLGDVEPGLRLMQDVAGYQGLDWKPYLIAAMCHAAAGRDDEAKALIARTLEAQDNVTAQSLRGTFAHTLGERGAAALDRVVELGLPAA